MCTNVQCSHVIMLVRRIIITYLHIGIFPVLDCVVNVMQDLLNAACITSTVSTEKPACTGLKTMDANANACPAAVKQITSASQNNQSRASDVKSACKC